MSLLYNYRLFVYLLLLLHEANAKKPKPKPSRRFWPFTSSGPDYPPIHYTHHPGEPHLPMVENGTALPGWDKTPDFRVREPPYLINPDKYYYYEQERPIRMSPHYKQQLLWSKQGNKYEQPWKLGCYCTTVYRRETTLAGCAVLNYRHVLTTATSAQLVLTHHPGEALHGIYGIWYDWNGNYYNSSLYINIARIHFHPRYMELHQLNITMPIPCYYDLATLSTTGSMHTNLICDRGSSFRYASFRSSTPRWPDTGIIVGFQFVRAHYKNPMPYFKYAVKTKKYKVPCPKLEWGWFHCIEGWWARYGIESGAAWHRTTQKETWLYDGLIGMCAFSSTLRAQEITHYFTVLDQHPVLEFLYKSYLGHLPARYLDWRFWNSDNGPPVSKWYVPNTFVYPEEPYGVRGYLPSYK